MIKNVIPTKNDNKNYPYINLWKLNNTMETSKTINIDEPEPKPKRARSDLVLFSQQSIVGVTGEVLKAAPIKHVHTCKLYDLGFTALALP